MRRLGGRGYTKYFQELSLKDLLRFISNETNIKQLIPDFSKLGEELNYVKAILTIMIKEELKHRQDVNLVHFMVQFLNLL